MNIKKTSVVLIVLVFFVISEVNAQVSIAPTSLFFDNRNRVSSLTVSNGGEQPQEISIDLDFGYTTFKNGRITVSSDSAMAEKKSIASWINVFPKNFTLQSQQRQVVRFIVKPPEDIDPGGHWSRIKIKSNPVSPPIESVGENQVGTQINLILEQVITAHYRTPGARTGLEVTSVEFLENGPQNTSTVAVSMEQTGNAPFVGTISLRITDSGGETVYQTNATTSVYTTITRTFPLDTSGWEAGTYTLSGTVTSQRRDISQENILQIEPVSFNKQITIE